MSDALLLTPRRHFLVRALAFTAAGASLSVPIVSVASAQDRVKYHMKGLEDAYRDLYAPAPIIVRTNDMDPARVLDPEERKVAIALVCAGPMEVTRDYPAFYLAHCLERSAGA